jgi:signal transduction histidine kinase
MKFKKFGFGVKFVAVLLFIVTLLAAFWSLLGVGYMVNEGYYRSGYSFSKTELSERVTRNYADMAFYNYFRLTQQSGQQSGLQPDDVVSLEYYKSVFSSENTNFVFKITGVNGSTVLTNDDDPGRQYERTYFFTGDGVLHESRYMISCAVRDPLTAADDYTQPYEIYRTLSQARTILIVTATVSSLLSACLFIYLMYAAGRRDNSSEIVETWQHRIPLDVFTAGLIFAGYVAVRVMVTLNLPGNASYGFLTMLPVSFILFLFSFVALAFCMNLAVHIKRGKWWRNIVIYRVLSFAGRTLRKLFNLLPMIWKSALLIAGYLLINCILTAVLISGSPSAGRLFVWVLFNFAVFTALCLLMFQMKTLRRAGERIATGDYVTKVDTNSLVWDLKRHAENLNNIVGGMSKAVEERLKSERLKTELITNVSHDLKTPLTSIINYIDLLKRVPLGNETADDYIAVLDRQSTRLKKLTEDLLEASKAATGNISVSFERTDLVELLNQSVGEYMERFDAGRLDAVYNTNSEKADIRADGRLLWRVFDNLLNNICKYSLVGTRVYVTVDAGADLTKITFLNISRDPLNISPEELMERFVRGDVARSTEGSGLGLSISKSLTELLGGGFELLLEGDLFKTVLTFKTLI